MKLIIDIPDHVYEWVKNTGKFGMYRFDTAKVIQNGIPLDSVKAEIKASMYCDKDTRLVENANASGLKKALEIIGKHIGKAENTEGEGC